MKQKETQVNKFTKLVRSSYSLHYHQQIICRKYSLCDINNGGLPLLP